MEESEEEAEGRDGSASKEGMSRSVRWRSFRWRVRRGLARDEREARRGRKKERSGRERRSLVGANDDWGGGIVKLVLFQKGIAEKTWSH